MTPQLTINNRLVALLELRPKMFRFAYGICQSQSDAEDIVQSAFERAITRLEQWRGDSEFKNWIFAIVKSTALNHIRANQRRMKYLSSVEPNETSSFNTAQPDVYVEFHEVALAVARLPQDQREAVLLVAVEGRSYREAAAVIGISEAAMTSRLSRGRIALARSLSPSK